jgi:prepilin-type N-terminal cleavage/methylation domain-containing protein
MKRASNTKRGFSLIELMAAMAVGAIVIGGAAELFKSGMDATALVAQQADMQQNVRSALNMVARDVSMAGSGLPPGGVALPYGVGSSPSKYACDQTATCYVTSNTYPTAGTVTNFMYGLIPGSTTGMKAGSWTPTIPATGAIPDRVTSAYVDYSFPLNQYSIAFNNTLGNSITATPPATPPAGFPGIISPTGLNIGDLVLLTNNKGSAVGEVTGLTPLGGGAVTINFANTDALNINQSGAASANIAYIAGGALTPTIATRLWVISYYVEVPATGSLQAPRLMRQVSGLKPQPVADNIIGITITYDACDDTNTTGPTPTCAALADPIASGYSPSDIHKVNIQVLGQSVYSQNGKSRSMALVTSVSTRSLSFKSRY